MGKKPKGKLIHLSPAKLRLLRIFEIDRHVRAGRHPNATTLAVVLEIHPRTVHRDIEFLRNVLGAPIEYDPLHRGWRYTEPDFSLANLELPEPEREALESARLYLAKLVASSLGEDVDALFEKLSLWSKRNADTAPSSEEGLPPNDASPIDMSAPESSLTTISLLFRGTAASVVVGMTWNENQKLEILSDGPVRLEMTVPMSQALERWILGWADEVLVEAPIELAAVIAGRQRRALRRQEKSRKQSLPEHVDTARSRSQVTLDFESEGTSEPTTSTTRTKPSPSHPEDPVQSDFGFKGRSSKRRRRKKKR